MKSLHPIRTVCIVFTLVTLVSVALFTYVRFIEDSTINANTNSDTLNVSIDLPVIYHETTALSVEIAQTPEERSQGLMFRNNLAEDTGMLFIFPEDTDAAFWMSNTFVPLDIAFLSKDGHVLQIDQRADTESTNQTIPNRPYRYALETNLGWFAENDIVVGDTLALPEIR